MTVTVNVVVLAGEVATDPITRSLPTAELLTEIRVAVPEEGKRLLPLPVVAYQADCPDAILVRKGQHVLIHGRLHRRFYRSGAGARSLTEVVATGVKVLEPMDADDSPELDPEVQAR